MSNKGVFGVFVCSHSRKRLDTACKELQQSFPGSVCIKQYLVRNLPFRRLITREIKRKPGVRLIIIGNTNPRFGGQEAFEYLMERSRRPLTSWGALDLRLAEETGSGEDLKEAVEFGLRSAKDEINKSLNKLN